MTAIFSSLEAQAKPEALDGTYLTTNGEPTLKMGFTRKKVTIYFGVPKCDQSNQHWFFQDEARQAFVVLRFDAKGRVDRLRLCRCAVELE